MRCPDCEQGTIYQARCRKKNGECITVYRCDINKTAWAEELCREKEILYDRFLELEEIEDVQWLGKADLPEISRADFYGWDETHPSALNCPYCRNQPLIYGISRHTKRMLYECDACKTIWIGSAAPEHVANYRRYIKDGLRTPDEAEIDSRGLKFLLFDESETTDRICPKCGQKRTLFGKIHNTDFKVYQCRAASCRRTWWSVNCEVDYRRLLEQARMKAQRCPDCNQGTVSLMHGITADGKIKLLYHCSEDGFTWAGSFSRETAVDGYYFAKYEGIVDYEGICILPYEVSREDYYGWITQETTDIDCPYCRTEKLIHGITAHSKREIYECGRCHTAWIGGVTPEHISNYRKYDAEALRLPDETEFDRGGMKFLILDDAEKTDIVCPKCKNKKIIFGRIRTTQLFVYQCMDGWCRAVWKDSVTAENEIPDYRAYIAAASADG